MHAGVAHGNRIGALKAAGHAETCFLREIAPRTVGILNVQIAAATDQIDIAAVVGEHRADGGEIAGNRKLCDEHDRLIQRACIATDSADSQQGDGQRRTYDNS
jgi:hypothetical protein